MNIKYILKKLLYNAILCREAIPPNVHIGKDVHIGSRVRFDNVEMGALITLDDQVTIADGVRILCHDASSYRRLGVAWHAPVNIQKRAFIGGGAIILPGITIGEDAIVAAGSVVTRDIDAGTIVAGNPARKIGYTKDLDSKRASQLSRYRIFDYSIEAKEDKTANAQLSDMILAATQDGGFFVADSLTFQKLTRKE